jgi:hypothetical protein
MLDNGEAVVSALENRIGMLDPTFVVGCPRSGTTLLARLVGTHPCYAYLEELQFVVSRDGIRAAVSNLATAFLQKISGAPYLGVDAIYAPPISQVRRYQAAHSLCSLVSLAMGIVSPRQRLQAIVSNMLAHTRLKMVPSLEPSDPLAQILSLASHIDDNTVSCYVEKYLTIVGSAERMRILFKDFSILSGKPYVVEKTPGEDLSVDKLLDIFPHAKMLHIYRDGRDVVASQLFSRNFYGHKRRKPWRKACQTWLAASVAVKRLPHVVPSDRYLQIRYEEFVSDLSYFTQLIFAFLGVPVSNATQDKISSLRPQDTGSHWEKDMTEHLRQKVSRCLNTSLRELGYDERT